MTLNILQLLTFAVASLIFVLTPGPGIFAVIAKSMTQGAKAVLGMTVGMAVGDVTFMVLSVYGLSALASNFHELFVVVRIIGAGYLFYLAYKMWTTLPEPFTATLQPNSRHGALGSFMAGLFISLSNPKVILFYVSLLPSFFPVATLNHIDTLMISGITFISVIIGLMAYALLADYTQRQLRKPDSRRIFNRAGASLMGGAGVWLLTKS